MFLSSKLLITRDGFALLNATSLVCQSAWSSDSLGLSEFLITVVLSLTDTTQMKKQSSSSSGLTTGHSFTSRSMEFSTPATSVDESNRWSDVVPPKTALTFAVVWDPDSDMVAFSGASLLDAAPTTFSDASSYARSSTLRWFQDNHEYLFSDDASRLVLGRTQTSSALMDATMFAVEGNSRTYSCLDGLGHHTSFDPRTDFAKRWDELLDAANASGDDSEDESFFEVDTRRERLLSCTRLTILTTSFLAISPEDASSTWSALETPTEAHISPGRKRKKLRKPRPNDVPKPPDVVLQRKGYNHAQCKSPRSKSRPQLPKFLSSCRKSKERRRWACIEVTQEIAQHTG